jgi:T5SS/PEP-CTERM-associated repeat protein
MDNMKKNLSIAKMITVMRCCVVVIVAVLLFQTPVFGLTFFWTGQDGSWSDRNNWSLQNNWFPPNPWHPRQIPNSYHDSAVIPDGSAGIDADKIKLKSLYVGPIEGDSGKGAVTIINGGGLDVKEFVTVNSPSDTSVLTVGRKSVLNTRILTIGDTSNSKGEGLLCVTDGASMSSSLFFLGYDLGTTGSAVVSGQGSGLEAGVAWVGYGGEGTLNSVDG